MIRVNNDSLRYNYVIVGSSRPYYISGYHDIMDVPGVSYHTDFYAGFPNFIGRQLVRWNFSKIVNNFVKTPFAHYVYPRLYPHHFLTDKPLCFVFFKNNLSVINSSYIAYLRSNYPDVRCVLFLQDLVKVDSQIDIEKMRNLMDLLISYDKNDSVEYKMLYHPTPMSYIHVVPNNNIEESDVYFCGKAKNRYTLIHDIYSLLTKQGLKCDFNIMEMPPKAMKIDGIHYHDSLFDSIRNLQHIQKTKCLLEIMQDGAIGFTPRLWESIVYDKHLLSNNPHIQESDFFQKEYVHDISEVSSASTSNWLKAEVHWEQSIKDRLSPFVLLKFIDDNLLAL